MRKLINKLYIHTDDTGSNSILDLVSYYWIALVVIISVLVCKKLGSPSIFAHFIVSFFLTTLAPKAHNPANVMQHAQHIGFSTSFIKDALEPPVTAASLLEIPLLFWLVFFYLWV